MNKIFKVVFNKSLSTYVAVSELAKGKSKSSKTKTSALVATGLLSLAGVASASYLTPYKPSNAIENLTYHPEEISSRVILEDVPVGIDELSKHNSFKRYFSESVLKNRKYESDKVEGQTASLVKDFKVKAYKEIDSTALDSKSGSFTKRLEESQNTRFFLPYNKVLVSVLENKDVPLIDTDTLHTKINLQKVNGFHFGFEGRVVQYNKSSYALSQKTKKDLFN